MSLGSSIYKLTFDSNAREVITPTRRELSLAKKIMEETRTATERYGESLDVLNQLLNKDLISTKDYNRSVDELRADLPANKAAQEDYNASAEHAAKVLNSLRTPVDDYREAVEKNDKALKAGLLSQEEMNRANEMARQKLPEVAEAQRKLNADMERGKRITADNETEIERYAREMSDLNRLLNVGAINERDFARETQRLKTQLLGAENATEKLSNAMREGRSLTASLRTAEEKRADELQRVRHLLSRGAISQETYNRHLAKSRAEQMQNIPVVGQLTSRVAGIHPAAIAAGAGIAILAMEMRLAYGIAKMLTNSVKEQFKEIDELAKAARSINMDPQSMIAMTDAVEEMSGMDFGGLEKSLQQMTRRVSESTTGTGEAKDALEELGLSAVELNSLSPDESFKRIADAISEVANTSDQARLAYDLFGRQGIDLLNTLRAGSAGMEESEARARELGNTLSEIDVSAVERMNDQLGDVGDVITGIIRDLAVDVAPALTAIGEALVEALKPGSQLGDDIRFAFETIPPVMGFAADKAQKLVGQIQLVSATAVGAAASILQMAAAADRLQAFSNPFAEVNAELQFMANDMARQAAVRTSEALENIAAGSSGSIQRRIKEIREEIAASTRNGGEQNTIPIDIQVEAQESADKLASDVKRVTDALSEQIATFGMSAEEIERYKLAGADPKDLAEIERLQNIIKFTNELNDAEKERQANEQRIADLIDTTTASLKEQLDTIEMSADEKERYKLAQQGVGEEELRQIEILQQSISSREQDIAAQKEAGDISKQLTDDIDKYTKELEKQIATQGMSADEIKRWELAQRGAGTAELERIRLLQEEAAATDELTDAIQSNFDAQKYGERSTMEGLARAREQQELKNADRQQQPLIDSATVDTDRQPVRDIGTPSQWKDKDVTISVQQPTFDIDLDELFSVAGETTTTPNSTFSVLPVEPVGQPSDIKDELKKQTKLSEQIAKNTAQPLQLVIEEVTL